jgi:hypothetical protein
MKIGTTRWFHPRERTLIAFALGDLADRAFTARHLERCSGCRHIVGFTQRLTRSIDFIPVEAPSGPLDRALAERAAGTRVLLPGPMESPLNTVSKSAIAAVAVLIVAAVLTVLSSQRDMRGDFASVNALNLLGFVPREAEAGEVREFASVSGHRLRALDATYQFRFAKDDRTPLKGFGLFDVRVALSAQGAWLVTSSWSEIGPLANLKGARMGSESVTVADGTLAATRRTVHLKPYSKWSGIHVTQDFRNDSIVGQALLEGSDIHRPIARDLRGRSDGLITSDALALVYFMGVPLRAGAEFNLNYLGWAAVSQDFLMPMRLTVAGDEHITTPAGTFDCWRFVIASGGETRLHWVRKSDHLAVLTRRRLKDGSVRELVLVRER